MEHTFDQLEQTVFSLATVFTKKKLKYGAKNLDDFDAVFKRAAKAAPSAFAGGGPAVPTRPITGNQLLPIFLRITLRPPPH